ncbi:MAG: hypothetical protein MJE77_03105 [Proteobacteria bacterium]|nr:hypothetical protein [Pseudomonadota bacterium]
MTTYLALVSGRTKQAYVCSLLAMREPELAMRIMPVTDSAKRYRNSHHDDERSFFSPSRVALGYRPRLWSFTQSQSWCFESVADEGALGKSRQFACQPNAIASPKIDHFCLP